MFFRVELEGYRPLKYALPAAKLVELCGAQIREEINRDYPPGYPFTQYAEGVRTASGLYLRECTKPLYSLIASMIGDDSARVPVKGGAWNDEELHFIVQDYFVMLDLEMKGIKYTKSNYMVALSKKLVIRTPKAVEYKHQNISHVLINSGYPRIKGFAPAPNIQKALEGVVLSYINTHPKLDEHLPNLPKKIEFEQDLVDDPSKAFVEAPSGKPSLEGDTEKDFTGKYGSKGKKTDYDLRNKLNKEIGRLGEEWVLGLERARLIKAGRSDLSAEIVWISEVLGDGYGYDIKSFDHSTGYELHIEVKSTRGGHSTPFYISSNELNFSRSNAESFRLYRVFQLTSDPRVCVYRDPLEESVSLVPMSYRVSPR